jgi:hypothetical protein
MNLLQLQTVFSSPEWALQRGRDHRSPSTNDVAPSLQFIYKAAIPGSSNALNLSATQIVVQIAISVSRPFADFAQSERWAYAI